MGNKRNRITKYIGPWPDGLTTRHEGSYDVAETFLHNVINLDVTDYGVLVQRPGFVRFHDSWGDGWPASFTNYRFFRLLGSFPTAIGASNRRLYLSILEFRGGNWQEDVYFTDDPSTTGSPTLLFSNNHGVSVPPEDDMWSQVVLYNSKLYFIRNTAAAAGAFQNTVKMDNGDSTGATAVAVAAGNSKYGYYAFIMQDRLFIVDLNGSRVDYSKATDPENFTAPDGGFFNVSPGDAQQITAVLPLEDVVYIFKEDSTYAFQFNTDPAVDGILRQVNKNMGASDATNKGSDIWVVNKEGIFQFIDGRFISIADNISTILDAPDSWGLDQTITVVEDRLIIGNIFELGDYTSLCMNLRTGAWTKYLPVDGVIAPTSKRSYIVAASAANGGKAFMVWGDYTSAVVEDVLDSLAGYFSMMRIGGDINDPDNKSRDQDRLGFTWVPRYSLVTVPLGLDDPTRWKKLHRWRFNFKHVDFDNEDNFPSVEVREGDPDVIDGTDAMAQYKDFYNNFFDSADFRARRFKVMQFGINKPADTTDIQAGPGIDQQGTFRVRGLSMEYSIKGPFRN